MKQSRCSRAAGLTLLEVLVAMTIAALLALALNGALRLGGETLERLQHAQRDAERLALVERLLRSAIEGLVELEVEEGGVRTLSWRGTERGVLWVTWLPQHPSDTGVVVARLALEPDPAAEGSERLTLALLPWAPEITLQWQRADRVELLTGLEHARWRYYDGRTQRWLPRWDDARAYPWLAELSFERAGAAPVVWVFALPRGR